MEIRAKTLCAFGTAMILLGLLFVIWRLHASTSQTNTSAPGAFRHVTQAAGLHFQYDNDVTP